MEASKMPCRSRPQPFRSGPAPARLRFQTVPFLDEEYMVGPPKLDHEAFLTPKLRRCPFDPTTLVWAGRLGGGADGYVWKVKFGDQGPFALKVFYDTGPPELDAYYSAQRECQNMALLQMMATAVESSPVLLNANPRTKHDAVANLGAFSTQGRVGCTQATQDPTLVPISSLPRMRQCYGWMTVHGQALSQLPRSQLVSYQLIGKLERFFTREQTYTAVVYEYVEEDINDPVAVEAVATFLWLAGFSHGNSPLAQNWKSGVLIDLSDIVHPLGFGWQVTRYGLKDASILLRE